MAFVPVPATAQFTMVYQGTNGSRMVNVVNLRKIAGDWSPEALEEACVALADWHLETYDATQSNQVALVSVEGRDLSTQDSYVFTFPVIPAQAGAGTAPVMPNNVTLAIKFGTPYAGRSFRGRVYHIGASESSITGDFWDGATVDLIVSAWRVLQNSVAFELGTELVVVSRVSEGVQRAVGVATPVSYIVVTDLRVDTQRRRLSGSGS